MIPLSRRGSRDNQDFEDTGIALIYLWLGA